VNRVVPQLVAKGKYTRPVLGLEIDEQLSQQIAARSGTKGVAVARVMPGFLAEAAGLRPGDVIVAVDGKPVTSGAQLVNRLDEHKVGDAVRLAVQREGKPLEVTATLKAGT
jgi:S1-C subfamily serine protease